LGVPLAIAHIKDIRGHDPDGVVAALREVLKYATKGQKGSRHQVRHSAAVELAFRDVHRVSIGGALRRVKVKPSDGKTEDVQPEDLHDAHVAACEACGTVGQWRWVGIVSAEVVTRSGGFGLVLGPGPPVLPGGP
jgi:hypothetical protein